MQSPSSTAGKKFNEKHTARLGQAGHMFFFASEPGNPRTPCRFAIVITRALRGVHGRQEAFFSAKAPLDFNPPKPSPHTPSGLKKKLARLLHVFRNH